MERSHHRRWLWAAMLFGIVYLVVGITFGALANSRSDQARVAWRLAAWLVSAAAFAVHIAYEQYRLRSSLPGTALRAAAAAALGAFGLAVAANIRAQRFGSTHERALALALITWPALTMVPAFVVALAAAAVLARSRRRG